MSDIRLHQIGGRFDVRVVSNDLEQDEGLETAIIISLFCDRRVSAEELPPEEQSRRGWWGDVADDKDLIGSKLWLLRREKITPETLRRAKEYSEEALKWLLDDGVASSVVVTVERGGLYQINIGIAITQPNENIARRFAYVWAAEGVAA